jgi:octaprenyl-diphosphate synthase
VIDFVIENGGIDYSVTKMNEYRDRALEILNTFPDNEAKQSLIDLVHFTTSRSL